MEIACGLLVNVPNHTVKRSIERDFLMVGTRLLGFVLWD